MSAPPRLPAEFVERLRRKDPTLFSDDPAEQAAIGERLGWVDAPARMQERLPELDALVADVRADGFDRALVLGMGGSSLAAELFGEVCRGTPGGLDVRVCDSTVPSAVRAATAWADLGRCLLLVASKSGTTAEVDALVRHFRSHYHDEPSRFVAITDPGTPLETLAAGEGFRACVRGLPDVGGRFSALTPFGLVPAALAGADLAELLAGVAADVAAPAGTFAAEMHRGLAALMDGPPRHVRALRTGPGTAAWLAWAEQLYAESTGKQGRGILPVPGADRPPRPPTAVPSPAASARQMYREEWLCAALGCALGVNPFDQPDVESAKRRTREQLARVEAGAALEAPPAGGPRDVHALLADRRPGDEYLGLLAFVHRTDATEAVLHATRLLLWSRGLATSVGYGPRYLHSTGQFHKGGPDCGVFVVITADDADLPIAGRPHGFQTLCLAQAYGDLLALRERGRRVVHWQCGADVEAGLRRLQGALAPPLV